MSNELLENEKKNFILFPSLFFFVTIMFIPKLDILPIFGYWQGIRIEDILILSFLIVYISNSKNSIYHSNFLFKNFLFFFIYIILSNLIAILSGIEIKILMIIRLFEYVVLLYFFDNFEIKITYIKKILYIYISLNFFIAVLQYFKIVGSISSLGYLNPSDILSLRSMGLTGGSWELGAIASIIFFTIYEIEKNYLKIFLMFLIVNLLLVLAASRGNFAAFNCACIILFLYNNKILIIYKVLLLFVFSFFFLFLKNYIFLDFFDKIFLVDLNYLLYLLEEGLINNNLPSRENLENSKVYLSFWYRVKDWSMFINEVTSSNINILFGLGLKHLYYDSLLIRSFVSTGLIGVIFILFLTLRLKIYLLVFFLLSGAFLDLFISMKIFFFTLIMLYVHSKKDIIYKK